jgi:hypothetical protein
MRIGDTVACMAGFPCPEFFGFLLIRGSPPTVQKFRKRNILKSDVRTRDLRKVKRKDDLILLYLTLF